MRLGRISIGCVALALAAAPGPPADRPVAPVLRDGSLDPFHLVGVGPEAVRVEGGELRIDPGPFGYVATKATYRDFALNFEWRYDRPDGLLDDAKFRGNAGVLIGIDGPAKVWPRAIEIQLAQADPGAIFGIGGAACDARSDPDAQRRAVRPVGEWNRSEIVARGESIVSRLNGVEVARGARKGAANGPIAWMAEGYAVRFRDIRIGPAD